jgi:hypothetical protein
MPGTTLQILPYEVTPEIEEAMRLRDEIQQAVVDRMKIPDWCFHEDQHEELYRRQRAIQAEIHKQTASVVKLIADMISLRPTQFMVKDNANL